MLSTGLRGPICFEYGTVQLERVLGCQNHRVTVISASEIGDDEGHLYELPLPPSLSGIVGVRRLVVSLAWLTQSILSTATIDGRDYG